MAASRKSGGRKKTGAGKARTYDLHNHVVPESVIQAVKRDPKRYGRRVVEKKGKRYFDAHGRLIELRQEFFDVEAKIDWMDRAGMDVSAISVGPAIYFYWLASGPGTEIIRLANDGIAQMVDRHPDRLRGLAHLPMQDPDAAIDELERVVKEYRFKGVELGTSIEGLPLSDRKFRKVLKAIEKLGLFVLTHPYQCMAKGWMDQYYLRTFVGFPLDTTLMASHLMFSGAMDELKKLRFLLVHGGGFLPYQIGRFEHGYHERPEPKADGASAPAKLLKRFYFDCLTHDPRATRHLINLVGADHVFIGTDNPYDMAPKGDRQQVGQVDAIPGLTRDERMWICEKTAKKLLGER
jgi:aminocarboxymuconate-semialdehyde decarboxylase